MTTIDELIEAAKLARENAGCIQSAPIRQPVNPDFSRQYAAHAHGDFDRAFWYIWRAKPTSMQDAAEVV